MSVGVDFYSLPIFIVNYNQLACLRKQLAWLINAGYKNIRILDNQSNYPPLLEFYKNIKRNLNGAVDVVILEKNYGCRGILTETVLNRFEISTFYVYSDGDVVPDVCCPSNVVAHLASLLHANPDVRKVGLGLRLDDLPATYRFREQAIVWESQFWRQPVARGAFRAPIDTTFAIYRPHEPFALEPALRTGWPYLARHEPWYSDSSRPTEEERFYQASHKVHDSHWAAADIPQRTQARIAAFQAVKKKLLHLACGRDLFGGWINLDVRDDVGADVIFDLNMCSDKKLPFEDDSIDGFYMSSAFQYIENTFPFMEELYRVAKPQARFIIRLPHGGSDGASRDRAHEHRYFPNSFEQFGQPIHSSGDFAYSGDWQTKRVKLIVDPNLLNANDPKEIYRLINIERNIVREMIVELVAVKPKRPREVGLIESPKLTLSSSLIDDESSF
jgi:SAM-dependent methyltransferase